MALENEKGLPRRTRVFVIKETTKGTFEMPAGTDAIRVTELPTPAQNSKFTDLNELANTRSRQGRTFDGFDPANFSLNMNMRLPGVAATKPPGSDLWECAFGLCTVGGSDVTYEPAISLPSFSAIVLQDHIAYYISGGMVNTPKISFKKGGPVTMGFDCLAVKAPQAGTSETTTGSSGTTVNLVTGGAESFAVGAYVKLGADDNAGAGFEITAVDTSADTLTLSTAPGTPPGDEVKVEPFVPTASYSGEIVEGATGRASLDAVDLTITSAEFNLANDIEADTEELTGEPYPSDTEEGQRTVTANMEARFRLKNAAFFHRAHQRVSGSLELYGGAGTGGRFKFTLGQVQFDTPSVSADGRRNNISLVAQAFPSAANEDECNLVIY